MSKYFVAFKCSLCGAIIKYGGSFEMSEQGVMAITKRLNEVSAQSVRPNMSHKCKDGNIGVAYYAGNIKED